jgi:tetratricopeptide (TPR) repeat protein
MKLARMLVAIGCAMGLTSTWAVPQATATPRSWDEKYIQHLDARLAPIQDAAISNYLEGEPVQALFRLHDAIDETNWMDLFVLANATWTMHPVESFAWQQRAYALSGGDDHVLLELALQYTRQEQCEKAIDAWQKLDKAGLLVGDMPMIAGYCYLQLGQDERAFSMFDRARSRHGGLEKILEELWGRTPAIVVHAERLKSFKTSGNPVDLDAALANAIRFDVGKDRGRALLAISEAAAQAHSATLATPLTCLRPVFEKESTIEYAAKETKGEQLDVKALFASINAKKALPDLWKMQMESCTLLAGASGIPESSVLTRFLVTNSINMSISSYRDLLASQGSTLAQRANSERGDQDALEVLAALQEREKDPGLKKTDTLGWEKYGLAPFATSSIRHEISQHVLSEEGKRLLARAHGQFPHDPDILLLWLDYGSPDRDATRQGWRELAMLQFHTPSIETDELHFEPVAKTLYRALQEYRSVAGLP